MFSSMRLASTRAFLMPCVMEETHGIWYFVSYSANVNDSLAGIR